jgi:hypothetical protein
VSAGGLGADVFQAPQTTSVVLDHLVDGTAVSIICTARGEFVSSLVTGYTSDLWNYTTASGFIPDAVLDTGTNAPTMPDCFA